MANGKKMMPHKSKSLSIENLQRFYPVLDNYIEVLERDQLAALDEVLARKRAREAQEFKDSKKP